MLLLPSSEFANLPTAPKVGGGLLVDGKLVAETYRCVHCSAAWQPKPGSGRQRGYCMSCKGLLCGQEPCMGRCIPLEARLQGWEGGKTREQVLLDIDSAGKTIAL